MPHWETLLSIYLSLKLICMAIGIACIVFAGLLIYMPDILKFVRNKKDANNRN